MPSTTTPLQRIRVQGSLATMSGARYYCMASCRLLSMRRVHPCCSPDSTVRSVKRKCKSSKLGPVSCMFLCRYALGGACFITLEAAPCHLRPYPAIAGGRRCPVKKGRHRRHQQAREIKQGGIVSVERDTVVCDECNRQPHAEWCMAEEDLDEEDLEDE